MSKNRDKLSLVAAILDAAKTGAPKTRIMYRANLSFKLLEKYLEKTLSIGFIRYNGSCYELTEQGQKFLSQYKNFHERYSTVHKTLKELTNERALLELQCQKTPLKQKT